MIVLVDRAIKYANDVVAGIEVTTWEVEAQCKMFLEDYNNRQHLEDFEFYFDEQELEVYENLLKLFNFATGFVAGEQVLENLAGFQCFFIANVFGWRYKDRPYKFRCNNNTLFIARKNAKTALIALVFLLLLLTEQDYSEFYSICLTKELAAEIKKIMEQIIGASPLVKKYFKVSTTKTGRITCKLTGSYFEPRVNESGKNNSVRPAGFVADERGNFTDNDNYNAMKSGQKNVLNNLIFKTTTAYEINDSIMEEDLEYSRKVLKGVIVDERHFALIYYAYTENLWNDTGIYQANPLRIEANYQTIREDRKGALEKPSEVGEYLTKAMNVFTQESKGEPYIDDKEFKLTEVEHVDFTWKEVVIGVDASIALDLTSVSASYKEVKNGKTHYFTRTMAFLGKGSLDERREKIDYYKMERLGYCKLNEGRTVDYNAVENYIRTFEENNACKIASIVADPFNMKQTMDSLSIDYNVVMLTQSYGNLTVATQGLKWCVYNNVFSHEKNELLRWCVSNAVLSVGKAGHVMIDKPKAQKNKKRIDMCASTIFTMTELYEEQPSYNALEELDKQDW